MPALPSPGRSGAMWAWANVWLQTMALMLFLVLRLATAGWTSLVLILWGVPLLAVAQLVLSVVVARRERPPRTWTVPLFAASALCLVVAAGLISDQDDYEGWMIPVRTVAGAGRVESGSPWLVLDHVGWGAFIAFLACLVAGCVRFASAAPRGTAARGR